MTLTEFSEPLSTLLLLDLFTWLLLVSTRGFTSVGVVEISSLRLRLKWSHFAAASLLLLVGLLFWAPKCMLAVRWWRSLSFVIRSWETTTDDRVNTSLERAGRLLIVQVLWREVIPPLCQQELRYRGHNSRSYVNNTDIKTHVGKQRSFLIVVTE